MIHRSHVYMCRYSFGTAVQVLPIPELMPFRLTRQMAGVLQPHDALALLQAPCTLAMTALRSGKDILEVCNPFFFALPLVCFPFSSFASGRTSYVQYEALPPNLFACWRLCMLSASACMFIIWPVECIARDPSWQCSITVWQHSFGCSGWTALIRTHH